MKIDTMADDFDNGKGKKKDSVDFAQIMNVVNDIKSHVKSLNPVTFESLRATLANVLDAHPEVAEFANIKEIFEQLELALKEEEQRVKAVIASLVNDENKAAEVKRLEEEAAEKAREEIERRAEVAGVYKAFDSFHKDFLDQQKEENKHLDDALKAIEEGRDIDEETKKKLTKTPEQIEEEKRLWQNIEQTYKTATDDEKRCIAEIQRIKKLEEKVAHLPKNHPERVFLANERNGFEQIQGSAKTKKAECVEHYEVRDEWAKGLKKCQETEKQHPNQKNKNFITEREEVFRGIYEPHSKEIAEAAIKKEADQIRQSLIKNNNKKNGDNKKATTDKTKATTKNNNKTKGNQQWAI
ncbi:hypothetical protein [Candidatus Tisiphia endosymbiont of Hybos culiciformis]|uniref:hypothetical protein n=1 Tax=Candidatus Tisiphia endosymbiont of Hybos culiciformis TaxID=3139331 RepID=UPI003CCB502D